MTTSGQPAPRYPGAAVITGAARGLGRQIAVELHRAGYAVHLTDVDAHGAAAAAEPLGGWSSGLDVRDEAGCAAIASDAAVRPGGLAVWVNNAGVLVTGPSWTHDAETRQRVLEINALGAINGTLAALTEMRAAGRGHVINVVSLAGLVATPGESIYGASKHALLAFSLSTLAELRAEDERDVHISCICPDGIWTPMISDKLDDAGAALSFTGRLLRPEEVAVRVARLVDRPRPVVTIPRWRGVQVRLLDAFPAVSMALAKLVLATGRAGQRRYARRINAGRWP